MALPAAKQKCYICNDEVTEADYRRELTCSYVACPGSEHAYHEECITDYLRKVKLPVDRLIGYQCPVVLDNGRPCTGRITATHHRQPINQKKKLKRVEAAAAAAAVPKPKPPAPKLKESKQAMSGLTAAKASGDGVVQQRTSHATTVTLDLVRSRALSTVTASTDPSEARWSSAKARSGDSMAPERVVLQRVIPGWSGPEKVSKLSTLEQQRAMVRAQTKNMASRNSKLSIIGAVLGSAAGKPSAASRQASTKQSAGAGEGAWTENQQSLDDSNERSEESDYATWPREGDSSDGCTAVEQQGYFDHDTEAFTLFPAVNAFGAPTLPSATPPAHPDKPEPSEVNEETHSTASPYAFDTEGLDQIVYRDPLYEVDGIYLVQDAFGMYVRVEEVYGPNPEILGFWEPKGVAYYVIIRQSHVDAHMVQQEQTPAAVGTEEVVAEGPSPAAAPSCGADAVAVPFILNAGGEDTPDQAVVAVDQYGGVAALTDHQVVPQEPGNEDSDIDYLLALCLDETTMVSETAAVASVKPSVMFPAVPPAPPAVYDASAQSHGVIAAAPTGCMDTNQADGEDLEGLMQLLCV